MAYWIGMAVGAVIATYLLTRLITWLLSKAGKMQDTPTRATAAAVFGFVLSVALYGFGNANGGPWNPGYAWIVCGAACVLWWLMDMRRIRR